jgi:PIN domain nuclease of toxin-antitoxin system
VGHVEVILLDTHAAVWLASADPSLGPKSCSMALAARAENQLAISSNSFWEKALLVSGMHYRPAELRAELLETGILTGDIALLAVELKHLHGDPADRFIAATPIAHDATLLTGGRSAAALAWQSKASERRDINAET